MAKPSPLSFTPSSRSTRFSDRFFSPISTSSIVTKSQCRFDFSEFAQPPPSPVPFNLPEIPNDSDFSNLSHVRSDHKESLKVLPVDTDAGKQTEQPSSTKNFLEATHNQANNPQDQKSFLEQESQYGTSKPINKGSAKEVDENKKPQLDQLPNCRNTDAAHEKKYCAQQKSTPNNVPDEVSEKSTQSSSDSSAQSSSDSSAQSSSDSSAQSSSDSSTQSSSDSSAQSSLDSAEEASVKEKQSNLLGIAQLQSSGLKNYYEILGIDPTASGKQVMRRFRKLSILVHPDRNDASTATEDFQALQAIYDTLRHPAKRFAYNCKNGLPRNLVRKRRGRK